MAHTVRQVQYLCSRWTSLIAEYDTAVGKLCCPHITEASSIPNRALQHMEPHVSLMYTSTVPWSVGGGGGGRQEEEVEEEEMKEEEEDEKGREDKEEKEEEEEVEEEENDVD